MESRIVTKSGLLIASSYTRTVFGGRGSYLEFGPGEIIQDSIHIPKNCLWRFQEKYNYVYYYEYRSNDSCDVMIYYQRRTVKYADYKVDMWYISTEDVEGHVLSLLKEIRV